MPLSRRYSPELAPNEGSLFGMDYSYVIPPGVGINIGQCAAWENSNPPVPSTLLTVGDVSVIGRTLVAFIEANDPAAEGIDFQIRWIAFDTEGGVWPRTALVLCAQTS